jgi:hypothetical protein
VVNINDLVQLGDEFDSLGQADLADRVDRIIKLAADVRIDFHPETSKRKYNKEEHQRLLTVAFEHLVDLYYKTLPKIDYLKSFWDVIRSALETSRSRVQINMKEKTQAFDYQEYKKWAEKLKSFQEKLIDWNKKDLSSARVLQERFLILTPLKQLIAQLERTYSDDQDMEAIREEWQRILIVFDNIFDQTTAQITGEDLKYNI